MKVPLNVLERLTILNSLPIKGTMRNLKLMRIVKAKVSFQEPEMQKFGIAELKDAEGKSQITWFPEADRPVDLDFTVEEMGAVSERLKELDTLGELKDEHVSLWDKFVQE